MSEVNNRQSPGSIRNRILIFSILVTLVPSIGMGWFWYDLSRKATDDKVQQKLVASAGIIERGLDLWLKERIYDLRVFSNSFVVTENVAVYLEGTREKNTKSEAEIETAIQKLSTYFNLIIQQFSDYYRLSVLDTDGRVLASSHLPEQSQYLVVPESWKTQFIRSQYFVGDFSFSDENGAPLILVGVPLVDSQDDSTRGFIVLEVQMNTILPLLNSSLPCTDSTNNNCSITLVEKSGRQILGTHPLITTGILPDQATTIVDVFKKPRVLQEYVNDLQERVVGVATPSDDLPWGILVEESQETVYAKLNDARNRISLIAVLLTIAIGGGAIKVARQIIIPLKALTSGVLRVANGDLEVNVPVRRNDELGLVTDMFNEMVVRLGKNQSELEEMATTDALTGLANRKQIMANLGQHLEGYARYATVFGVVMIDIDYFKKVNDTYGHPAGDAVLIEAAGILHRTLRSLDTAGRYGGEEFMVVLDSTDLTRAVQTAERIRLAFEDHVFQWQDVELRVTISAGVAAIRGEDKTVSGLISRVDKELYKAKEGGRNRVCYESTQRTS